MRRLPDGDLKRLYSWPVPIWNSSDEAAAHLHAVTNKQVAWIALVGVLISAAVSFGSAELASRRSADSATAAIEKQVNGETDRSKAEFLRGQRQVLYSNIMSDESLLWEAEQRLSDIVYGTRKPGWREEFALERKRIEQLAITLDKNTPTAEVIASDDARRTLAALIETHGELRYSMTYDITPKFGDPPKPKNHTDVLKERQANLNAFFLAARKDMGA
jgi:hypothetical protein